MLTAQQKNAVQDIWTRYQADPKGHNRWGKKYVIGPTTVQIVLTEPLFEYSEAAAGVMGYGVRPVGIRRRVTDAFQAIDEIMQSPDTLEQFILSSDRTGPAYCEQYRQRSPKLTKSAIKANDPQRGFWSKYSKEDLLDLKQRCTDSQQLLRDFQTMTLAEFEEKYELAMEVTV